MKEPASDAGSISVFVVGLVMSFMVSAGLALDGGRLVSARVAVADHAENAARIGAQQVGAMRSGLRILQSGPARIAVLQYLRLQGLTGEVVVRDRTVTVTTRITQPTTFLQLVGVYERTVSATRTAEITSS
ncbi:MAG: hypothetical protein RL119_1061 [Actinomycetota bacterium]|jgi:hypothetical protein